MIQEKKQHALSYTVQGEGQPVVLIHGLAASRYDWEAMLPAIAAAGYRGYAVDLLGHGDSLKPRDPQKYKADIVYDYLEAWIDRLELEEAPLLVGHSLGGYFSMLHCLEHPQRVKGLALIDPFYSLHQVNGFLRRINRHPDLSERMLRWVPEWLFNLILHLDPTNRENFSEEARQQIADDYKRASPHILHIPSSIRDLNERLDEIEIPSLVIWGEDDLTLHPTSFSRLIERLPNGTGHALPGCGHQPHIGKPELVNRILLDFFQSLPVDYALYQG